MAEQDQPVDPTEASEPRAPPEWRLAAGSSSAGQQEQNEAAEAGKPGGQAGSAPPELPWDASGLIPERPTLERLRRAAAECRACDLYLTGTQTVFGAGPQQAEVMFVGEQPGDQEDRAGQPFVGPAGRVLDEALEEVGIDRSRVYVTNAVKHFKWVPRGKRRIHNKPNTREVRACVPWLHAELQLLTPRVIVLLGATAAQALLGPQFRVSRQRGQLITGTELAPFILATVHPASIIRITDAAGRHAEMRAFVEDLRKVRQALDSPKSG